ncbi:MAG: hypothetical protein E3J64_06715 [Anaerolineales bacterium]|nr:MAG: hypothetical protein E3J64_06715 [Anaerolineales bacterium]
MSRNARSGPFPSGSRGQVFLTAAPPIVYGLGIAAAALAAGGPWHSIAARRLYLSIALIALAGIAILAVGVIAALRRLPAWGYTWAGAAVMMAVLAAQTVAEELAEQGTLELPPVAESIVGLVLVLANLSLLIVAAVRGRKAAHQLSGANLSSSTGSCEHVNCTSSPCL